jgi:hypothetical protein
LDLTQFVWDNKDASVTAERFCEEESELVESAAVAANGSAGGGASSVVPIDVEPMRTRGRLARSALLHPWESLVLISRYSGGQPDIGSLEEAGQWRRDFAATCPHAFGILFTERESYMHQQISDHISSSGPKKLAVLIGVSHVDALFDLLVSSA